MNRRQEDLMLERFSALENLIEFIILEMGSEEVVKKYKSYIREKERRL